MIHSFRKYYRTLVVRLSFFFNDTPTTEIYTLSLHDALPISVDTPHRMPRPAISARTERIGTKRWRRSRSEEHTSELQSHHDIVCRLLLEKINTDRRVPREPRRYRGASTTNTGSR